MSADTITIRPRAGGFWYRVRAAFGLLVMGSYNLGPSAVVLTNPEWLSVEAPAAPKGNSP